MVQVPQMNTTGAGLCTEKGEDEVEGEEEEEEGEETATDPVQRLEIRTCFDCFVAPSGKSPEGEGAWT